MPDALGDHRTLLQIEVLPLLLCQGSSLGTLQPREPKSHKAATLAAGFLAKCRETSLFSNMCIVNPGLGTEAQYLGARPLRNSQTAAA